MPELRPSDWTQIGAVVPQFADWHREAAQPEQPIHRLVLAAKLDALAVRYIEESREAKQLAASCRRYASQLRAGCAQSGTATPMTPQARFAALVRSHREKLGLGLREFCIESGLESGLDHDYMGSIERGRRLPKLSQDRLEKRALGLHAGSREWTELMAAARAVDEDSPL